MDPSLLETLSLSLSQVVQHLLPLKASRELKLVPTDPQSPIPTVLDRAHPGEQTETKSSSVSTNPNGIPRDRIPRREG